MKLAEFIHNVGMLGPETHSLEQAIGGMLNRLGEAHLPTDLIPEIQTAVIRRERSSTTAIGRGMAIPHAGKLPINRVIGAVAVAETGLEAESLDGRPVSVVFLLLLPPSKPNEHQLYRPETEALWRFLRNDDFYSCLRQARTGDDIKAVFKTADAHFEAGS